MTGPLWLSGVAVALWGRHELYVRSLLGVLSQRGADVRVLDDLDALLGETSQEHVRVLLLESPLPSEVARLAAARPPVIVLAEHARPEQVADTLALGAHAVLEKNASLADLLRAIRSALEQHRPAPIALLTRRQRDVLRLIAEGLDNAQIAERLGISQRTARAHVSGVLERLGVENRTQAAVAAVRSGWLG